MATLRFFSTLIIALLLLAPLLKTIRTTVEKPVIVFVNDNTESLKLSCENKDDKFTLMQQSVSRIYEQIAEEFDAEAYSFGDKFEDGLKFDYTGKQTNIEDVLDQVTNKYYNKNIGALVLITDGIYTAGTNPIYKVENISYPIYSIAIGDTTVYKDLLVKDLTHNEIAFLKNKFPLEITIAAKKLKGKTAVCQVTNNGRVIHSENIEINSNDFLQKITIFIEAEKAGIQQYNVSLTRMSDERNTKNNYSSFAINVVENKQKILILANSPNPDIAAFRSAMKSNQNFEIDFSLVNDFNKNISDYSLVILHQLPSKENGLTTIYPQLMELEIPILVVLGMQTDFNRLNNLNLGLKVAQSNNAFDNVQGFPNVNFSDFDLEDDLTNLLSASPPLVVPFGDYTLLPHIKTVVYQRIKNINTLKPLIAVGNASANYESNVGFVLGEGMWRWRMFEYKKNGNFDIFDNTINQIVQFLVMKNSRNRFIVKVDRIIPENDEVLFKAEVYNKIFELNNENDVNISVIDSSGRTYDYVMQRSNKAYFLNVGTLPVGSYNYSASTKLGEEALSTGGTFAVVAEDVESQDLVANHTLLYKMSQNAGGKFIYPDNIDSLTYYLQNDQNIVPVSYTTQDLTEFIKYKWIFFLILALLSVEWFLRKFFGTY
ncbi:MAG: hypothetical protein JXL97_06105 [Bacteroidales bacterium]|nr:hypothetical protein [Bacteroidales bacterium]